MNNEQKYINDLKHIREMMQSSTRFMSLSGLSGILAGVIAIGGAFYAHEAVNTYIEGDTFYDGATRIPYGDSYKILIYKLIGCALVVLALVLTIGFILTGRKAKKNGQSIWGPAAKKLMLNMGIPLLAGGTFSLILMHYGLYDLVPPSTLIFYGLGLINASNYTLGEIKYLGLLEVGLGLLAMLFLRQGILFWALGFGVLHIIYGSYMYFKYDK